LVKPTLEEMKRYWGYQRKLRVCRGCIHESECWLMPGAVYLPEIMIENCPYGEVKEAVKGMQEMEADKPLGYYAIQGDWWSCEELWKVLER